MGFIVGMSGTGKSHRLLEEVKKVSGSVMVLTPTHKAKKRLIDGGLLGSDNEVSVSTIHAYMGLIPMENIGKKRIESNTISRDESVEYFDNVLIDEFSMIEPDFFSELIDKILFINNNCNIIVFGDPYQLPPISGKKPIDPYSISDVEELTTQYRSESKDVVEMFTYYKECVRTRAKFVKNIECSENIEVNDNWVNDFKIYEDQAIVYTNKKANEINRLISEANGLGDDFKDEEIILNNINVRFISKLSSFSQVNCFPTSNIKGGEFVADEKKVNQTLKDIEKYRTKMPFNIGLIESAAGHRFQIYFDNNYYETKKALKDEVEKWQSYIVETYNLENSLGSDIKEWCNNNRDKDGVRERGQAWSAYIAHSKLVFNASRPFAISTHKSQGSEYKRVFLAHNDLSKARGNSEQFARLMYVAISRAKSKVFLID